MNKEVIKVPIDSLKPHPSNPRRHGEKQIAEIQKSLKMYGQYRDVLVDEDFVILAGHGLVEAMKGLGEVEASVMRFTGLSDSDKKKLLLVDNRVQTLGTDDIAMIVEIINDLDDVVVPGYDQEILESMLDDSAEDVIQQSIDRYDQRLGVESELGARQGGLISGGSTAEPQWGDEQGDPQLCKCPECGAEFKWE